MTLREAEDYILSFDNLSRPEYMRGEATGEHYIRRMNRLLLHLDHPETKIPHYIHVAGTSGKGSVCTFLASVLHASGKTTGLMTSPHATSMRERWQINGRPITEKKFIALVEYMKPAIDACVRQSPEDPPSVFEVMTALGFLFFAKEKVSWAVVEVGLGGRYDATNVLPQTDVAIITNIGLDHTELLGGTVPLIAREKAGIIQKGSEVFLLDENKNVRRVIEKTARQRGAQTVHSMNDKNVKGIEESRSGVRFQYQNQEYHLNTLGAHQAKNAALVIDVAKILGVTSSAIARGLVTAHQPLRLEVVKRKPLVIIDGAHNPQKMETTVAAMKKIKQESDIVIVFACSGDKDAARMIRQLATLGPRVIACTRNTVNFVRPVVHPSELKRLCTREMKKTMVESFMDPTDAWVWARQQMRSRDILLITGSFFSSGQLRIKYFLKDEIAVGLTKTV